MTIKAPLTIVSYVLNLFVSLSKKLINKLRMEKETKIYAYDLFKYIHEIVTIIITPACTIDKYINL